MKKEHSRVQNLSPQEETTAEVAMMGTWPFKNA